MLTIAAGLGVALLGQLGTFDGLERTALDLRFRHAPRTRAAPQSVAFVTIDEASLRELKRNGHVWKWPRDLYGLVVEHLAAGGAKAIVFDMLFADADVDRAETDAEETDGAFAAAMRKAGNVLLAIHLRDDEDPLAHDNPLVAKPLLSLKAPAGSNPFADLPNAVPPIAAFQEAARGLGGANYTPDDDGVCRRLPPVVMHRGRPVAQLGPAAYLVATGTRQAQLSEDGRSLRLGDRTMPLDESGASLINWYGPGGPGGVFEYHSIASVIGSAIAHKSGRGTVGIPASTFKDKVVFVGSNAPALFDLRPTPFTSVAPYPAMEIHATVLANLLDGRFLTRPARAHAVAAVLLGALLIGWMFSRQWELRRSVAVTVGFAAGWVGICIGAFVGADLWLEIVTPLAGLVCSFLVAATAAYWLEGRSRRRLRRNLDRYVSPAVVDQVLSSDHDFELGGRLVEGSVLFSDIAGFTTISERMNPRDLVDMLCEYFRLPTSIVLDNRGLLDKYIGDAIMAVFGAPLNDDDHAVNACAAAVQIHRAVTEVWPNAHPDRPRLETRIGVASGEMVVGNIGSEKRFNYTAIGDTVNLAARLEGANKAFGTSILISQTTAQALDDSFVLRRLSPLGVKGKEEAIRVYELVGRRGAVPETTLQHLARFDEALTLYEAARFHDAKEILEHLLAEIPEDGPAGTYLKRCRKFAVRPPEARTWTGEITLEVK